MSHGEIHRAALDLLVHNMHSFPHPRSDFGTLSQSPNQHIITARSLHPEPLCVKDVYGAIIIRTQHGIIEMYGRNGLTHGSPQQLEQYSIGNLKTLTDDKTDSGIVRFLRTQREQGVIMSCRDLAIQANCAWCLKHLQWSDIPEDEESHQFHEPKPSEKYCPNSIAKACTERLFLNIWLPHAIELQNQLIRESNIQQGEKMIIRQVKFNPRDDRPDVEYIIPSTETDGFLWRKNVYPATPHELAEAIRKILLITQYAPCIHCANDIERHPLVNKLELHMAQLSRHIGIGLQPRVGLDGEDIDSLAKMIKANIPITYDDLEHAKLVWR